MGQEGEQNEKNADTVTAPGKRRLTVAGVVEYKMSGERLRVRH